MDNKTIIAGLVAVGAAVALVKITSDRKIQELHSEVADDRRIFREERLYLRDKISGLERDLDAKISSSSTLTKAELRDEFGHRIERVRNMVGEMPKNGKSKKAESESAEK
jgi:hypothetical protein